MADIIDKFFQLIRYSIGTDSLAPDIKGNEWESVYELAKKQSILGVLFETVLRMAKDTDLPRKVKLNWYFFANKIRERNMLLNQRSAEIVAAFRKDGFDCCVLKGQGNALMYPDPYSRVSGDIDVLVSGGREIVTQYVKKRFPHTKTAYQHIDYPLFRDVPVEVHYLPAYLNNPIYNRRLKKWFDSQVDSMYGHEKDLPDGAQRIPVPSLSFNLVFQLVHMQHHLLDEGIGLRQMIDYYYLLEKAHQQKLLIEDSIGQLDRLGLYGFTGAVMYIMHDVLGLDDDYLLIPVDKKRGQTLLREILHGGNFGKYSGLKEHTLLTKHFLKYWRTLHFVREYPAEALSEPFFRTWHFFWRLRHK